MQGNHLYEYAVIRAVPCVERDEFVNVGVILFCKRQKYIRTLYRVNEERIRSLSDDFDIDLLHNYLQAFSKVCDGAANCGPIARMDVPERFRWLTAVRSSSLQTTRPHPGFSPDLDKTLQALFAEQVLL
ncbi:hypothetical protein M2132_000800 [Dysgonomonas sp. PH5-45]|uniref:DUF3037 domain-containing protein n=1 Tax=unclassified Dysgonomonas TaxID=2630389 RepID=UPI002473813A|nr:MULTISPECIES: DUF3037 domain-containing protein [unclassified Dysgonomonas]MDH6354472.1 hypothetical protein [Dysgonomonas sp. PH5-45]MDH6387471.1 hypothetical protein [Dysgonomonas sp. PH5-37]